MYKMDQKATTVNSNYNNISSNNNQTYYFRNESIGLYLSKISLHYHFLPIASLLTRPINIAQTPSKRIEHTHTPTHTHPHTHRFIQPHNNPTHPPLNTHISPHTPTHHHHHYHHHHHHHHHTPLKITPKNPHEQVMKNDYYFYSRVAGGFTKYIVHRKIQLTE